MKLSLDKSFIFSTAIGFVIGSIAEVVTEHAFKNRKKYIEMDAEDLYNEYLGEYARDNSSKDKEVNIRSNTVSQADIKTLIKDSDLPKTPYKDIYKEKMMSNEFIKAGVSVKNVELFSNGELFSSDSNSEDDNMVKEYEKDQKDRNRPPRIISVEKLGDLEPSWEVKTLFYYTYDETLVSENDEVIEDPYMYVGDALDKYGFVDNEESCIYVQNFRLHTIYEVEKCFTSSYS